MTQLYIFNDALPTIEQVGGKGLSLIHLANKGFPVKVDCVEGRSREWTPSKLLPKGMTTCHRTFGTTERLQRNSLSGSGINRKFRSYTEIGAIYYVVI